MIVGILKEIKPEENRVCMIPAGVEMMVQNGHSVLVEMDAGAGSSLSDEAYVEAISAHMAVEAYKTGRKVFWDESNKKFVF